ncbi:MAG: sensor histidine kinase [Aggregatilineales bacterium]
MLTKRLYKWIVHRLMNRLWVRLSLAFILVTQLSVFVVAVMARASVNTEFQSYIYVSRVNQISSALSMFYSETGSWNGVDKMLLTLLTTPMRSSNMQIEPVPGSIGSLIQASTSPPLIHLGDQRLQRLIRSLIQASASPPLILANAQGTVIYDSEHNQIGLPLSSDQLKVAIPLGQNPVNNPTNVVGYLLPRSGIGIAAQQVSIPFPPDRGPPGPPPTVEQQFLDRMQRTLSLAALMIGMLGIFTGLAISRTLVAPLNQLERAARTFGSRDWSYRIKRQGTRELAAVASAFNDMADELQRAELLRRNLVADIAHELRTPLSVMQANLMALLDGLYPLDKREIATLYEETCMLSRLVSDLRELAQADAGQLELDPIAVNVQSLLDSTAVKFTAAAEVDGTQVQMQPCANDWVVCADAGRVTQVLGNLVANALRHTPGGAVTLSAESAAIAGQVPAIRIIVADNGEGIPPDDVLHVFERFYRVDKSRARTSGNSGLGLAIAKAWVEAMGGRIGVESVYGKGSRFWFALPVIR